jgi:glycolate oxidase
MKFEAVTPALMAELRQALGDDCVHVDDDTLEQCASDETEDLVFRPEVVVTPRDTAGISAVMRIANLRRVPVTPRGAGTGLSGGALPVHGGIVLSTRLLNRIIEIDTTNLMAVVEPGVITQVFQETVEAAGLFYPPDPASRGSCFLGGNLAECSGRSTCREVRRDEGFRDRRGGSAGQRRRGTARREALEERDGLQSHAAPDRLRRHAGHHHQDLLPPAAAAASSHAAPDPVRHTGSQCAHRARHHARGHHSLRLEFMERDAIEIAERHLGKPFPNAGARAQLLIEIDGNDEGSMQRDAERITEIAMGEGATDVLAADTPTRMGELWALRRSLGVAVKSESVYKEEDTVVPRANLVALLSGVKEIAQRYGIRTVCYGHAGDGNLHVNILKMEMNDAKWTNDLPPMIREIFELTVSLGGMISGEHGIGWVQKDYLPIALSPSELGVMRAIKRALDPEGILNPGKIFPDD